MGGKKFEMLPKPIKMDDSSSDDDEIPENSRSSRALIIPKLKRTENKPAVQNIPVLKPPTNEELSNEAKMMTLKEMAEKVGMLRATRNELASDLKITKQANKEKLVKMRESIEEYAHHLEKGTGALRVQLNKKIRKLNRLREQQQSDERFVEMKRTKDHTQQIIQSFVDGNESVTSLASILQYSPLAESEFDVILNTGNFDSPFGAAVKEFLVTAKSILVQKQ